MKKFLLPCLVFVLCLFVSGCGSPKKVGFNIVTSCYPMYIIALNLTQGIDDVAVENLTENHIGCIHDFYLDPENMKSLEKANTLVINGAGMETFLDVLSQSYPNLPVIDSSEGVKLIEETHTSDYHHEKHDHHHESGVNPHIWVSVSNYITQVENISRELIKLDPKNGSKYAENATVYTKKLKALKAQMDTELSDIPNKNIVTFHEAFPYFAKEFNLNVVAVINSEPDDEPSAQELKDTILSIKKSGAKALFVEPQYNDNCARVVSAETGVSIYTLDSASSGEKDKDAYINVMQKNLKVLKQALS